MRIAPCAASAIILASALAFPVSAADFKDYPAKPAFGHVVTPTFTGANREHRNYRTMFRWGFKSAPRFAGHYAIMGAGCGTGCTFTWLGDLSTGAIYDFPRSGETYADLDLDFHPNSRLLRARWDSTPDGANGAHFCVYDEFVLNGTTFKLLSTRKTPGECPTDPQSPGMKPIWQ
jgi:hypothetical protein